MNFSSYLVFFFVSENSRIQTKTVIFNLKMVIFAAFTSVMGRETEGNCDPSILILKIGEYSSICRLKIGIYTVFTPNERIMN